MCDIARDRGVEVGNNMAFPFAKDKAAFDQLLNRPKNPAPSTHLGADIVQIIVASQPFGGGNDLLKGLNDLWNQDKHVIVMPVVSSVLFRVTTPPELEAEAHRKGKGSFGGGFPPYREKGLPIGEPLLEAFYVNEPTDSIDVYGAAVTFPADCAFPRKYVVYTLRNIVTEVESLIKKLDAAAFPAPITPSQG